MAAVRARGGHGRRFLVGAFWGIAAAGALVWSTAVAWGWRVLLAGIVVVGGTCGGILPPGSSQAYGASGDPVFTTIWNIGAPASGSFLVVKIADTDFPAGTYDVQIAAGTSDTVSLGKWTEIYWGWGGSGELIVCPPTSACDAYIPNVVFASGTAIVVKNGPTAGSAGSLYAGTVKLYATELEQAETEHAELIAAGAAVLFVISAGFSWSVLSRRW